MKLSVVSCVLRVRLLNLRRRILRKSKIYDYRLLTIRGKAVGYYQPNEYQISKEANL